MEKVLMFLIIVSIIITSIVYYVEMKSLKDGVKTRPIHLIKDYDQNCFDKNAINKETLTPYDLNGYNKD